jgi:hypothetical protein
MGKDCECLTIFYFLYFSLFIAEYLEQSTIILKMARSKLVPLLLFIDTDKSIIGFG